MTTFATLIVLGLLWGGVYLLAAEGLNLIYGVMKVVNLAHGDFIVFGGLLAFSLYELNGVSPLLSFPVAGLVLLLIGGVVQFGILERIDLAQPDAELRTLLATFGLSYVIANTSFLLWGSQFQSIPFMQGFVKAGPIAIPQALLVCSALAFAVAIVVHLWLNHTILGKSVRAVAQSGLGAASCGLDIVRIRMLTFALGSAMAGSAGALLISLIPFQTSSGAELTVQAFTLIALGGLGNYAGAFLAAELLGLVEVMVQYYLGTNAASAVIYTVFIAVLVFRPHGLLGRAVRV
ncbi:branched-chain amino acid ABC transporter permease [Bradyrhizobium sp.]|uniref:branched-chain amino acid ABC transporter permease n=1 Tax=Bradyrhizobium sp. TaxID=376 RepID=UPI003C453EB8